MFAARAFSTAYLSLRLDSTSGPPWRTADMIWRESLLKCFARFLSTAPLRAAMFEEWEWPATGPGARSALRELESATGAAAAVLLAFLLAAVAREQLVLAQERVPGRVERQQRARQAEHDRVGSAHRPAAVDRAADVVVALRAGHLERLLHADARLDAGEELVGRPAVDQEAARARADAHARDGGLAASQAPGVLLRAHALFDPSLSTFTGCCAECLCSAPA